MPVGHCARKAPCPDAGLQLSGHDVSHCRRFVLLALVKSERGITIKGRQLGCGCLWGHRGRSLGDGLCPALVLVMSCTQDTMASALRT